MDSAIKSRIKNQIFKFEVKVDSAKGNDSAFTLDYESTDESLSRYRQDELAGLIRDVVPYFALTDDEIRSIDKSDWNKQSFTRISDANRNSKGDYGELLLFVLLSQFYDIPKFVTKARLRSTTKEQVKGFDCAHFSVEAGSVTLWLGEAKFHKTISSAISSSFKSLNDHLNSSEKIKSELKLLGGEIEINRTLDKTTYDILKEYVSGGKSLDKIEIAVPVLLTYDSKCIGSYAVKEGADIEDEAFCIEMKEELENHFSTIHKKSWPSKKNIKITFFVVPFDSVSSLKEKIEQIEIAMKF